MKKSFKVGVLTFHYSNNNFGALLQTFAILNSIKGLGLEARIIDFKPRISNGLKQQLFDLIRFLLGYNFTKFRNQYIALQPVDGNLMELNNSLDTFVVGSDQVWRYREQHENLKHYFFDFVNDPNKKLSYAASFGLDQWHGKDDITGEIGKLVKRFDHVSVREASGVKICNDTFNVYAELVLDSTLLLDKSHYESIISRKIKVNKDKNTLLSYMLLDDSKENKTFFARFAKKNNLKFKRIKGFKISNKYDFWIFNSVAKWLYYISNSELIVTDSFHCTVFAIIFKKKFIVLSNPNRGITRIENLLGLIDRKDRLFHSLNDIDEKILENDFDYEKIDQIIQNERIKSLGFLRKSLLGQ
ncbi:polysaccharide pyruvyl transferase family protein [Flavobacteriaceae bacterium GF1]